MHCQTFSVRRSDHPPTDQPLSPLITNQLYFLLQVLLNVNVQIFLQIICQTQSCICQTDSQRHVIPISCT